ncbi:hypothetical protein L1049_023610 [Liquidambar formosana]|uniref:F-box domain-containing protein n=1 Tax=Liquidambar formosana TaxID=63359 RepID=A0AAP0WYX4_LIQFO
MAHQTETDRISDLPPQILSRIISHFTIRDVVIASVLSRTWKHLCASSKYYLNFTCKVEQLKLYALAEMKFDIQKTIVILRACLLLQKFHLVTNCPVNYEQGGISVPTERAHNYLKEVEFGGFYGTRNQIEFALYLLKYARALERMVIYPQVDIYLGPCKLHIAHRVSWHEGEREKVMAGEEEEWGGRCYGHNGGGCGCGCVAPRRLVGRAIRPRFWLPERATWFCLSTSPKEL